MLFVGQFGSVTISLTGKYLQAWFCCGCRMTYALGERKAAGLEATIALPMFPCLHGYRMSVMVFPALGIIADAWIDPPFDFAALLLRPRPSK